MQIIKIGGSVLKNKNGFFRMIDILNKYTARPLIVVVSAFSKATKKLESAAKTAVSGNEIDALKILDNIIVEHSDYAAQILTDKETLDSLALLFQQSRDKLSEYFKGLSITQELTLRTLDAVLSFGELFALHTVNHFLKEQGFNIYCIDSTSIIVSDDNYGRARPILKETMKKANDRLGAKIDNDSIILTQGFVAKNRAGEFTTMGIESSNLTAVLFAEIFNISKITLWTDAPGIMTADPKIVINPSSIAKLNYRQAYNAGLNGLKLIYPEMIERAVNKNIELEFKSAFHPDLPGTIINSDDPEDLKPLIISRDNMIYCLINDIVASDKPWIERRIYQLNQDYKDIVSYSVNSVSVHLLFRDNSALKRSISKLAPSVEFHNCSTITLLFSDLPFTALGNEGYLNQFQDKVFHFECLPGYIRIVVKPDFSNESVALMYKNIS